MDIFNLKNLADAAGLSPQELELLPYLLEEEGIEPSQVQAISSRSPNELPLSFAQQRLWFLDQLEPNSSIYNIPAAVHLSGDLNVAALQHSLNEIICRHEALRTTFATVDGKPIQVIAPALPLNMPTVKLHSPEREQVLQLASHEAQLPFDLTYGPLVRATLLDLGEQEHVLLLTMHHIVSDGWSMGIFIKELATLYEAFERDRQSPPELPIQYADFAHAQQQWLQGEVMKTQLDYWKQQLENSPPVLDLPMARSRPIVQTFRGAKQYLELSKPLLEALKALSQREGVTLFMTLLAAFKTLLYRYTGQDDIVVGSTIANRNRAEFEGLIGFFANTLVLRTHLSGNPSFRELLGRVRETTLQSYDHQDLPFERLVEELQPERDLGRMPLFQVAFVFQNFPMPALKLPGLTLQILPPVDTQTAKFDLSVELAETPQGLNGIFEYNTDLFDAATISRTIGHFQTLLEGVVSNPSQHLSELPLLTEAERHQLLMWNDTQLDYPQDRCIHQLFEAAVEQYPEAIALVFENNQLTYQQLNHRANQVAHYLRSLGVGPDTLVGLCVERSFEMLVGCLSILKAGGAYIPLDPAYPQERLALMLEDAQITALLTQQHLIKNLPSYQAPTICLDTDWEDIAKLSTENPINVATPSNLAYVIYTSGSTGTPKGVMLSHSGLCNLAKVQQQYFNVQPNSRVLQFASLSFDASVSEIFMTLVIGATLVLATPDSLMPGPNLMQVLRNQAIATVTLPPSALALLDPDRLPQLQTVVVAGEACSAKLVAKWAANRRFFNGYGPSESTVCTTIATCTDPDNKPPIGYPIPNLKVYILDRELQPVPIGVFGELHISGVGLARGYLNRPDLTALKFIPNPFSNQPGERLYKTGDRVRYLPNGEIEFLSRLDQQVKIRGFRIELEEIEAAITQHPAVQQAIVVAREIEPDDRRLVAYAIAGQDQIPTTTELRHFLQDKLPNFMLPAAFVFLETLPLLPNGKVNLHALPAPDSLRPELEVDYVIPRTELEHAIATVWQKVLNIQNIGIHDNFFDLGGNSLLISQVHSQLQQLFNTDLSLVDLFKYPTINSLAKYFELKNNQITNPQHLKQSNQRIKEGKDRLKKRLDRRKS